MFVNIGKRNIIKIVNEVSLQEEIVKYLRKSDLLFTCSLGGCLDTDIARVNAIKSGYGGNFRKGVPDLIIFSPSLNYNLLIIELKAPTGFGIISKEQKCWLDQLEKESKAFCLVSNDLCEIIEIIVLYINGLL